MTLVVLAVVGGGGCGGESSSPPSCADFPADTPERVVCEYISLNQEARAAGRTTGADLAQYFVQAEDRGQPAVWIRTNRYDATFTTPSFGVVFDAFKRDLNGGNFDPTGKTYAGFNVTQEGIMNNTMAGKCVRFVQGNARYTDGTGFPVDRVVHVDGKWYIAALNAGTLSNYSGGICP